MYQAAKESRSYDPILHRPHIDYLGLTDLFDLIAFQGIDAFVIALGRDTIKTGNQVLPVKHASFRHFGLRE